MMSNKDAKTQVMDVAGDENEGIDVDVIMALINIEAFRLSHYLFFYLIESGSFKFLEIVSNLFL